jgi:predicted nucleic acid-binding protein
MIAADTSTWIAFLQGEPGEDVELLDQALEDKHVFMSPPVLSELLSDPRLSSAVAKILSEIPLLEIKVGFWQRAGALRAQVISKRRKARLGDALIAQSCIDCGIVLLTRDRDFHAFSNAADLEVVRFSGTARGENS